MQNHRLHSAFCRLVALSLALASGPLSAQNVPVMIDRAADISRHLHDQQGPQVRMYRLSFKGDMAEALIQDARRRIHIDGYDYKGDEISGPIPVKFDRYPSLALLDQHVFDLDEVDLGLIPQLIRDARQRLSMPDADVSEVVLERQETLDESGYGLLWQVTLSSPRHDGKAQYAPDGRMVASEKD